MLILEDCTAIDAAKVTSSDLRAKADAYIALSEQIGPSKLAIIVAGPASFGFSRSAWFASPPLASGAASDHEVGRGAPS